MKITPKNMILMTTLVKVSIRAKCGVALKRIMECYWPVRDKANCEGRRLEVFLCPFLVSSFFIPFFISF